MTHSLRAKLFFFWKETRMCLVGFSKILRISPGILENLQRMSQDALLLEIVRIPVDTRSPIPVISVQSVGDLQYRRQS